jgi:hypothetical protein
MDGAELTVANLSGAYLADADLSGANLSGADLSGAYLQRANLIDANLSGANLTGAELKDTGVLVIHLPFWTVYIIQDSTTIGCQKHKNSEWLSFSDDEIAEMDDKALDFWKKYKHIIEAGMDAVNPMRIIEAGWRNDYTALIENGLHETNEGQELRLKLTTYHGEHHPVILDFDRLIRFQAFKLRRSKINR